MQAVILCGGQGTRLREETEFKPKPLVEIGDKPILWHIMKMFAHFDIQDFCLCLGYKGEMIKHYVEQCDEDFSIASLDTGLNTMTGARIKKIEKHIEGDTFMVTYGDGVSDVDIHKLIAFHQSHNKLATVTAHQPYSRYGVMKIQDDDVVTSFAEKPKVEGWVSSGFFVFDRKVLDYIPANDDDCNLEREPLQNLAKEGQLVAYKHEGFFHPMDTYRDFLHLNKLWDEQKAPWAAWNNVPTIAHV